MKKAFAIAALLLVVFSSGCTVPGLDIEIPGIPDIFGGGMNVQEQRHDIISIERLDAIPSATVRSGQSIRLRAVAKDLQAAEYNAIDKVEIGLYNTCGMFEVQGETCSGKTTNWDKDVTNDYSSCTVKMYPQSTTLVEWKLTAKEINVETPCKIGVMARYYYKTYASGSVTFVNKAEVERLVNEGKSFSETGTLVVGEGPVKPYIEVLSQPLIIDASSDTAKAGDLRAIGSGIMSFWVENKGGGVMDLKASKDGNVALSCPDTMPQESGGPQQMCLNITSTGERVKAIVKDGATETKKTIQECIQKHIETATGSTKYSFNFIGRETPKYSCSITLDNIGDLKQETTYQIKAEIGYFYKFTKELSITVQPTVKL
ncbi:MAG: hypothetical protein NTU57_03925 [Candidatus Aenigmarchaeota archaeon]|nr:hypothetical protein [Candidatus Aenigmarchaeota archaeon]